MIRPLSLAASWGIAGSGFLVSLLIKPVCRAFHAPLEPHIFVFSNSEQSILS